MKKPKQTKPVYQANYGGATLSDVTRAVLGYRPGVPKPPPKSPKSKCS